MAKKVNETTNTKYDSKRKVDIHRAEYVSINDRICLQFRFHSLKLLIYEENDVNLINLGSRKSSSAIDEKGSTESTPLSKSKAHSFISKGTIFWPAHKRVQEKQAGFTLPLLQLLMVTVKQK